jgi:hypothetical protein
MMTNRWDEFSKSLADESLPRRETLRRLGLAITATVLSPLGAEFARAGKHPKAPPRPPKPPQDPCKSFCQCRNKKQLDQCLKACNACGKSPQRLGGNCGNYFCCGAGQISCGSYCADLAYDPDNCGACGYVCDEPGPSEDGACIDGRCVYACVEGAVDCDGACTFLSGDPHNCGRCGNVCPGSASYCDQGVCICPSGATLCDEQCVDLRSDPDNCGACGAVCPSSAPYCIEGACADAQCGPGLTWCAPHCVDLMTSGFHCGACYNQCAQLEACSAGTCQGLCIGCE